MRRTIRVLAMALALVAAGTAQAIPLSTLLDGGSITVGDKLFDRWHLIGAGLMDTTGQVELANIDVTGLADAFNPGLRFDANGELHLIGNNLIDLYFGYRASVLPGSGMSIKDVSFTFESGSWAGDGLHAGIEDVFDAAGAPLGSIALEASSRNFVTSGSVNFAPVSELFVQKNILLNGFAAGDSSGLNSFTQRFSQIPIPEPTSLALVAVALAGAAGIRRRR